MCACHGISSLFAAGVRFGPTFVSVHRWRERIVRFVCAHTFTSSVAYRAACTHNCPGASWPMNKTFSEVESYLCDVIPIIDAVIFLLVLNAFPSHYYFIVGLASYLLEPFEVRRTVYLSLLVQSGQVHENVSLMDLRQREKISCASILEDTHQTKRYAEKYRCALP